MTAWTKRLGHAMGTRWLRTGCFLVLILIWYRPEQGAGYSKPDYVSPAKARFVLVTSECWLGSGFLTGYRENGKAEVLTAYHLIRCEANQAKFQSRVVHVDGVMAEIHGIDERHDLLRLLVPFHKTATVIAIRTASSTGERVFAVGSNPKGDRSVVTWGNVLITPPGEVTAKVAIVPGTSGGQLVSAVDGALLGVAVREGFGFTNAVSGNAVLEFLGRNRKR